MTKTTGVLVTLAFIGAPIYSVAQWPKVQPIHEHFEFGDIDKAGFDLDLKSADAGHKPLYVLNCHSGVYEADSGFDYSGLFDCRLVSLYSKEMVSSLLTDTPDQIADWHDRGRFLVAHLRKGCATYSDWGQRRGFRLRGMDIVITISGLLKRKNTVLSYSVDVVVTDDPSATTPLAEKSPTPEPLWFYDPARSCH